MLNVDNRSVGDSAPPHVVSSQGLRLKKEVPSGALLAAIWEGLRKANIGS